MTFKHKTLILIEEIFNSISHGIGVLFGAFGLIGLFVLNKQDTAKDISFMIFGVCLILMYMMSTLFHSLTYTKAKKLFQIFDKSSIFLLIAGTYTPLAILILHGLVGWSLLILVWCVAILGIVLTTIFTNRFKIFFILLYLLLGWTGLGVAKPLLSSLSLPEMLLLLSGGLLYSTGVIFYSWKKLPFNHTIWHLFVLGGSACHFILIYNL